MSVTLNHSPWLTMPSPSALSDCLGMAACCDIGPGPSLLWGRPVHCGMFRSLPGPCTTCQLGRAVISWLRESCCCEGSRSQPRALAPVGTSAVPASSQSVSTTGPLSSSCDSQTRRPTSHAQPASCHTALWVVLLPGSGQQLGAVSLIPFPVRKAEDGPLDRILHHFQGCVGWCVVECEKCVVTLSSVGDHIIIAQTSGSGRRALLPITWAQANEPSQAWGPLTFTHFFKKA